MKLQWKTAFQKCVRLLSRLIYLLSRLFYGKKMTIIPTSTNEADFLANFHKHITPSEEKCLPMTKRMTVEEEFVGNYEYRRFWITTHQRMKYRQYEKRYFDGRLSYENDRLIVVGRFKYVKDVYFITYPLFLTIIAMNLHIYFTALHEGKEFIFGTSCAIVIWLTVTAFAREKEKEIIDLIETL